MAQLNVDESLHSLIKSTIPSVNIGDYQLSRVAGLSSENWRITIGQMNWLARDQTAQQSLLGIDRQRERNLLQHVAQSRIAPKVITANSRWLILEWISGNVITANQFLQFATNGKLAALLAQLHDLPPSGYYLNLHQQLRRYGNLIGPDRYSPSRLKLHHSFLQRPLPGVLKLAPLHMDIHSGNILATNFGLVFIDWEYASSGDVALEIAALFCSNQWNREQQQIFLQSYCRQPGGYRDIKRLSQQVQRWIPWVDYLMLMWFEVRWQQTHSPSFLNRIRVWRQKFNLFR